MDKDVSDNVIEQIDGNAESTVTSFTIDLIISAVTALDAYSNIEKNLCQGDDVDEKVLFVNEVPSNEVTEANSELFLLSKLK